MWKVNNIQGLFVMTRTICIVITAALLIVSGNCLNSGDYYFGYFQNAIGDNNISVLLITTELQPVSYLVESPGVNYYQNGTLTTSTKAFIDLPDSIVVSKYVSNQYFGIHVSIKSDRVTVVGQTVDDYNSDTFLALPITDVPYDTNKKFIYYGMSVDSNHAAFKSMVLIVGIANHTNVVLRTSHSAKIGSNILDAGEEYSFDINKLQTFLIQSNDDLTGTKIVANNSVSVLSGHQASSAIQDQYYADHLIEQIPSTYYWGMKYYVTPFTMSSYTIKILAAYNATNVTIYCRDAMKEFYIIDEGRFRNISYYSQDYCAIHSNKKILVVQFSHAGKDNDKNNNIGEPLMTLVPATIHYMNKLDFSTICKSSDYSSYVNIVVMAQYFQPSMMYLQTGVVNTSLLLHNWVPIVANNVTEAYAAQVAVPEGVAHITHADANALMTAIVYGFAERRGYGHPAGLRLIDPCKDAPCGNLGDCLPDGNSYKCKCSDGNIGTSCTVLTSSISEISSTVVVPIISSATTTTQESILHTKSSIQSPSKILISSTAIVSTIHSSIPIVNTSVISGSTTATTMIVSTSVQNPTMSVIPIPTAVVCPEEFDIANGIQWPSVTANTSVNINCTEGNATRFCNLNGDWELAILTNCSSCGYSFLNSLMEQVEESEDNAKEILQILITTLAGVTKGDCTDSGMSSYYYELSNATSLFQFMLNIIEQNLDLLSSEAIVQGLTNSFSNVLDSNNSDGWRQLDRMNPGQSQIFLNITERFGLLLAENLDKVSKPLLTSDNIVIEAVSVGTSTTEYVTFSDKVNEINSILMPSSFIQCSSEVTGVNPIPVVNIYYKNMQNILSDGKNVTLRPVSQVLSSQVVGTSNACISSVQPIQLRFLYDLPQYTENNTHTLRCGYWNFTLNEGRGGWDTGGVTVIKDHRENFTIICSSTHLTSFAVLVDVSDSHKEFSVKEKKSLSILSFIGCGISIVCLLITIIMLVYYRNTLLKGIHNFIHLNLAIALLLALVVFISGIERAKENEITCKVVAALLHYFFTAVFTWMLCEGILLYFLLVKVFNTGFGERRFFYIVLGWGIPIPIVAVSAGIVHDHYGHDEFCWIETEKGSIWGFVAPMLAIIAVNVIFLLMTIRALIISHRSKRIRKESSQAKLVKSIIKATIILLPLLGTTWVFGLLAVNQNSSVFAWIFTILNSLQGAFIFVFHIIRNEKIWKIIKTCGKEKERIHTSMLSRQQSNTSFLRRNNSTTKCAVTPSDKLLKMNSQQNSQTSISDTDIGSCSNELDTANERLDSIPELDVKPKDVPVSLCSTDPENLTIGR